MKAAARPGKTQLFPGRSSANAQGDIKRVWASICRTAGLEGIRVHDLQHTHASILASSGASLPLIGALLGHAQPATTASYAHLLDNPMRAATKRVGAVVMGAGDLANAVVRLPRRASS